ncbi:hypothetical protein [Priestia megaterium]|uniref:hypothetical protein n=1 Tax=Priestia megaterium TaxID=1404 RepID=UPI001604E951|nr:hypothetical protein [Priestia megaterium]
MFRCFQLLIGGQGEDSCGKSGTDETPQKRKRRGGSAVYQALHTKSFIPFVHL